MDHLRPVETTVEGYPACHWPPQEYPPDTLRRNLLHMAVHSETQTWGFTQAVMVNDGLTRRLELLGPDSPGEFVYTFDRRLIDVRFLDDLGRDLVWWIRRLGIARKVLTDGERTTHERQEVMARCGPGHAGRDDQSRPDRRRRRYHQPRG